MHDALNSKRSIQTIRDHTSVIATHNLKHHMLEVRTLDNEGITEPEDLHFIITFKDDVENADASVKPLAEAILLNGRVRFLVKPAKQYPELAREMSIFSEVIEHSIRRFFETNDRIVGTTKADDSIKKWLLH
ncbi:hypothetical protein [Yersinia enterocolitica]|uniref:hypothetical protein n=1 Tax=Yersinia enterocolitica TaxID=630 RepID=UPI0005E9641E|nr:hypothetical protein [Yersinia enterocolitica]CQH41862.1 Uncharacterised protein [Yersinia enterocolitica]